MRPLGSIDTTAAGRHRVRVTLNGRRSTIGVFDTHEKAELERATALELLREDEFSSSQGVTLHPDLYNKKGEKRGHAVYYRGDHAAKEAGRQAGRSIHQGNKLGAGGQRLLGGGKS